MKSTIKLFGIIAMVAVIVFSMAGCGDGAGDSDSSNKTKFEGSWFDRDPYNPTRDYNVIKFTGNDFVYRTFSNGQEDSKWTYVGTFSYTDTEITWIAPPGPFTSRYVLNGNNLLLENAMHGNNGKTWKKE